VRDHGWSLVGIYGSNGKVGMVSYDTMRYDTLPCGRLHIR